MWVIEGQTEKEMEREGLEEAVWERVDSVRVRYWCCDTEPTLDSSSSLFTFTVFTISVC